MAQLPWSEKVPLLSINPAAADVDDIARLAAELMEARQAARELMTVLTGAAAREGDAWSRKHIRRLYEIYREKYPWATPGGE